ncbi:OLC1v1009270C1 [Oldenlandia corymbosa var. corymbosa]|uniref:OLC1v1009270C1 n=1 Tax=Oldenlandia corymbosa var. corymbosa TaxID=529605 RepID=A0AAV1DNH7_OLDCO|nr:OLC1v1009270C1 [Oldenlandia corymbosa var. corymbosa]
MYFLDFIFLIRFDFISWRKRRLCIVGGGEDVAAFSEKIKAVLMEAAFVHRRLQRESTFLDPADDKRNLIHYFPRCFELLANICLLKTELVIKEQLHISSPRMLFSEQFFKLNTIITDLKAFANGLYRESSMEFVKQSLVLVEELANEISSLQNSLRCKRINHLLADERCEFLLSNFADGDLSIDVVTVTAESAITDVYPAIANTAREVSASRSVDDTIYGVSIDTVPSVADGVFTDSAIIATGAVRLLTTDSASI